MSEASKDIEYRVGESPEQYRKRRGIPEVDWSEVGPELLRTLIKCRIALTPHVFNDEDAREARDLADTVIAKTKGK